VSKYSPLSEHEDYDWAIVPFEEYMHGLASPDFAPMIGTPKLQGAIERYNFGPLFSSDLKTSRGELPDGQWKAALATRFDRNIYILSVETSAADDAVIVAAFNAAPNKSRFNFFYRNCSNQAKAIFALILPQIETIGDRTSGITMETPKGLAKALVEQALENPELNLRVRRYAQIPGTFGRSRDVLFRMENTYRNLGFAPWWSSEDSAKSWGDAVSRSDLSIWDARVIEGFHVTEGRATDAGATSTETPAGRGPTRAGVGPRSWLALVETFRAEHRGLPTPGRDQKRKTGRGEPSRGLKGAVAGTGFGIPGHGSSPR
jgi:hypothetical protein